MSENKNRDPNQPNYTKRRVVAGGVAAVALIGAAAGGNAFVKHVQQENELYGQLTSPDAYDKYKDGDIKKGDVVVIKVKDAGNGNPDNLAVRIKRDGTSLKDLSEQIAPQVDAQGYPGVEQDETLVLEKGLVDPTVAEQWAFDPEEAEIELPEPVDPQPIDIEDPDRR